MLFQRFSFSAAFAATAVSSLVAVSQANAHVVLTEKIADTGTSYTAAFKVGHGCDGSPTRAITVTLPDAIRDAKPVEKNGWTLTSAKTDGASQVTWRGTLPSDQPDAFMMHMTLPGKAGPLWFKVLQECATGSMSWSEIPASGTSTKELKSPAALLQVMAPQFANVPVRIEGAWIHSTVPGQSSGSAFMKISSREKLTLVSASTPAAGHAEVHEMKMNGDIMQMREVAGLEVAPTKPVELTPGSSHLMLMDLVKPLANGSVIPLKLTFKNQKGALQSVNLEVPVALSVGAATGEPEPMAGMAHMHKH